MSSLKLKTPGGGSVSFNATDTVSDVTLTVPASNASILTDSSNIPAANLTGSLPVGMGGKILQVVSVGDNQQSSYTGLDVANGAGNYGYNEAGFDLTTLDIALTPTSTSSKILILTNINIGGPTSYFGVLRLKRGINGATPSFSASDDYISANNAVIGTNSKGGAYIVSNTYSTWAGSNCHFQWLDSPATTDEVKYRFNFAIECDGGTTIYLNRNAYTYNDYGSASMVSSVTLMEVAG